MLQHTDMQGPFSMRFYFCRWTSCRAHRSPCTAAWLHSARQAPLGLAATAPVCSPAEAAPVLRCKQHASASLQVPFCCGSHACLHLSAPQEHSQLAASVAGMRSASLALAAAVAAEGPLALNGAAATPAHRSVLPASLPASVARTSLQKLGVAAAAGPCAPNVLLGLRPLSAGRTAAEIGACMFWPACRG